MFQKLKDQFKYERPYALPWGEWDNWREETKKKYPIGFFFRETCPDLWWNLKYYLTYPYKALRRVIRNHITMRYHMVNTGLKPNYYDTDIRMLHACFNLLVDFVEVEKANMEIALVDGSEEKFGYRWYHRFLKFRSPEAGMAYLNWEITLTEEDGTGETSQAKAAKEVIALYNWWVHIRPTRADPYDGDAEFNPKFSIDLETQQLQEDEDMLIRLMKIRNNLWT